MGGGYCVWVRLHSRYVIIYCGPLILNVCEFSLCQLICCVEVSASELSSVVILLIEGITNDCILAERGTLKRGYKLPNYMYDNYCKLKILLFFIV